MVDVCSAILCPPVPSVEFEGALGRLPKSSITSPRRTLEVSKSEPGHSIEREVERDLSSHQKRRLVFFTIEKVTEGERVLLDKCSVSVCVCQAGS